VSKKQYRRGNRQNPKQNKSKNQQSSIWTQIVIILCTIVGVLIVLAFIGVQPLANYKNNVISRLSSLVQPISPQNITIGDNPIGRVADEGAITNTINGYYSAYNSQSFDKCLNYLSGSIIKKYGESQLVSAASVLYSFDGNIDFQIRSVTITGDTATASIYEKRSKAFMATSAAIIGANLVKENSQWKLNWQAPGTQ
jgi:hypothetical protein